MATTTLGWIALEREITGPARFTHNLFACEYLGTFATAMTVWLDLMKHSRTSAAAYFFQQSGAFSTDVEPILSPSR
jgi:hypothetical protein